MRLLSIVSVFLLFTSSVFATDRTITLHNKCPSKLYLKVTAGAAPNRAHAGSNCGSDGDCITGSYCASNKICFWNTPSQVKGNYGLNPGESRTITMPVLDMDVVWSGNIAVCREGQTCDSQPASCSANGCYTTGAATLAEFTLQKYGADYYDVSIINGVHVPTEMIPVNVGGLPHPDDYTCYGAGTNATWFFKPPAPEYIWVPLGGNACNSNNDCPSGQVCGLSRNPAGNIFKKNCGKQLGYWTADQVCGMNRDVGAPFNCRQASGFGGMDLTDYLMCDRGIPSCYQPNPGSSCCGCVNWWEEGVSGVSANSKRCNAQNSFWKQQVYPKLRFLKDGCSNCYTYPYDDVTSTYVCSNGDIPSKRVNTISYNINFCPNGRDTNMVASAF